MNKKTLLLLVLLVVTIILIYIDYTNYTVTESDIEKSVYNSLLEVTYPKEVDYIIEDKYEKGRIRFYSGQIFNEDNNGPFIIGFKKHWLLSKYKSEGFILRKSNSYITGRGKEIVIFYLKYIAYQVDDSHKLIVERELNTFNIFKFIIIFVATLLGRYHGMERIKNKSIE